MRIARRVVAWGLVAIGLASCGGEDLRPNVASTSPSSSPTDSSAAPTTSAPQTSTTSSANATPTASSGSTVAFVDLPGVDTSALVPSEKGYFTEIVSEAPSPCGDPTTIQTCVLEKRACALCIPAAQDVVRLVAQGEYKSDVERWLGLRFDAGKVVDPIPLDQHPVLGRKAAPIEIVEFADFECPFCGVAAPKIHALVEKDAKYANKVRLVFYNMPLKAHVHAEPAARAAWAAHLQGKFWPMHDQLFAHQDKLEDADLEGYAKAAGCDLGKWKAAFTAAPTAKRVADDYAFGEKIGVEGTPSIYVDRRKFTSLGADEFEVQLRRWLDEELMIKSGK